MVRLLLISFALFFFSAETMAADCGRFKVVKGKVQYKAQGQKSFKKANKNRKICQGATVKTGKNGRAKIEMADKNEINVSPGTEMILEVYQSGQKAVLNVINGKVRSDVKNKYKDSKTSHYRVKTRSAVAGVRGTEFLASYNAQTNQARVVTFEGEVAVGQMNGDNFVPKVTVKPGQFTSSSQGQDPLPPQEVPSAELAQMDQESSISETGPSDKAPASTPQQNNEESNDEGSAEEAPQENSNNQEGTNEEPNQNDSGNAGNETEAEQPADVPEPKADGGVAENENSNDTSAGSGEGSGGTAAAGPAAGDAPGVDGPDGEPGYADNNDKSGDRPRGEGPRGPRPNLGPDAGGPERDIASIDAGNDLGLPPPTLDDIPGRDNFEPKIPVLPDTVAPGFDPSLIGVGPCNVCNDAVINENQRVRVILRPVLPGSGQ